MNDPFDAQKVLDADYWKQEVAHYLASCMTRIDAESRDTMNETYTPVFARVGETARELRDVPDLTADDVLWMMMHGLLPAVEAVHHVELGGAGKPLTYRHFPMSVLLCLDWLRVLSPWVFRPAIGTDGGRLPSLLGPGGEIYWFEDVPLPLMVVVEPRVWFGLAHAYRQRQQALGRITDEAPEADRARLRAAKEWQNELLIRFGDPIFDARPDGQVQRIKKAAGRKGVLLPEERDEVLELFSSFVTCDDRSAVNRRGNRSIHVASGSGRIRVNDGQFIDWLKRERKRDAIHRTAHTDVDQTSGGQPLTGSRLPGPEEEVLRAEQAAFAARALQNLRRQAAKRGRAAAAALERWETDQSREALAEKHNVTVGKIRRQEERWLKPELAKLRRQAG